jgi:hypothetical protein
MSSLGGFARSTLFALALVWLVAFPGPASADLQAGVRNLARSLAQSIPSGFRVGVVEFTPAGQEGEKKGSLFGLALADLLATELAKAQQGRFAVVERVQLRKLVEEMEMFGPEDPRARVDLSRAGVRGIVTGTYVPSGPGLLVSARVVRVEDGAVLGGASEQFPLDPQVRGLLQREFPRGPKSVGPSSPGEPPILEAGVFYEGPNARLYPVKDGMVLYQADNYRIYFKPNRRAYVYVVQLDSGGSVFRLFPNVEGRWDYRTVANPVGAGVAVWVPEARFLHLDEKEGREEIYFFASENPIAELEGPGLVSGANLQRTLKLMGVGGSRASTGPVEVKTHEGATVSYETIRAIVNTRGDLTYQVWFWHR